MITEHIIIIRDPEIEMIKEAKKMQGTSNGQVLSKDLQATRDQHDGINEMSVTKKMSASKSQQHCHSEIQIIF